ncbi:MAG: hypothetical protein M3120_05755 [Pseudomonadota bacterium]|nr:hypothetical protein [Pseudomonadota bacterium]
MAASSLVRNWILSQLPEYEYRRLAPHLKTIDFTLLQPRSFPFIADWGGSERSRRLLLK